MHIFQEGTRKNVLLQASSVLVLPYYTKEIVNKFTELLRSFRDESGLDAWASSVFEIGKKLQQGDFSRGKKYSTTISQHIFHAFSF